MDLKKILIDESCLQVPGFSAADPFNSGNITMTGNGYLGFRGTFPDWSAEKYSACTVTNTFDLADGKWKELCNVPNGLYFLGEMDQEELTLESDRCREFEHFLNYRYGLTSGRALWESPSGGVVEILWERFASYDDLHLVPQKIQIRAHEDCTIKYLCGIDNHIWSLNGNHFPQAEYDRNGSMLQFSGKTKEKQIPVIVGHRHISHIMPESIIGNGRGIFSSGKISLKKGDELSLYQFMSVYSGNDVNSPEESVKKSLNDAVSSGYEVLFRNHCARWDALWRDAHIKINGDHISDRLLRYNMYHNFISTPAHTDTQPIGARGLSCQAYQGAAFWDQEIYNLPMFLYTKPEIAKQILIYRYKTLAGAKRKAERLGYAGAFYAWISGDTGDELCPDYFFKDVLTDRKIRNHFNDWQIHISPDISYTIIKYYEVTGDFDFLCEYGAEMLLEIALFLYSRVHFNFHRDRYEILKVLGPDEYHENADNNAFTNRQAKFALEKTLELVDLMKKEEPLLISSLLEKTGISPSVLGVMKDIAGKMFTPEADPRSGLIEQFDGYFQLEDISPALLKERLINEQEYWGWPNGIAYETQVLKQADVVQMFVLHQFPVSVMKKNYLYYEPRTQHRSSLSPGVHAIIAAQVGLEEQSYEYFLRSCSVDIANTHPPTSGGTFIGGIHTAACGIAWQIAVFGFAGMKIGNEGISFNPHMPESWDSFEYIFRYRNNGFKVTLESRSVRVESLEELAEPVRLIVGDEEKIIEGKGEVCFG